MNSRQPENALPAVLFQSLVANKVSAIPGVWMGNAGGGSIKRRDDFREVEYRSFLFAHVVCEEVAASVCSSCEVDYHFGLDSES